MIIRILKNPVGLYNLSYEVGEIIELSDPQARELVSTFHAEELVKEIKIETAVRVKKEKKK